ncbi:MAG: alpha/beta-hydrolase family protein [Paracoccus sp. (in: a-proteobacteria)]|nr:alpha/beta-hydrolase family protein [Paracoccus sp. (in: a-proteobacteria)]
MRRLFHLPQLLPLAAAILMICAALTPSLIPRDADAQGLQAGIMAAIGYGITSWALSFWRAFQLPRLRGRAADVAHTIILVPVFGVLAWFLSQFLGWQNSVRERVGMETLSEADMARTLLIAFGVLLLALLIGRAVQLLFDQTRRRLARHVAPATANLLGLVVVLAAIFVLTDRGVVRNLFRAADEASAAAARFTDPGSPAPAESWRAGSAASLIDWAAMGERGRSFVQSGPSAARIAEITGRPAIEPLRIYIGREQGESAAERAEIALAEMRRTGAFDRAALVISIPTGTGWMEPASHDALEYLLGGNVATVAIQYSYLSSFLALIAETNTGLETAQALFDAVYAEWSARPPHARPRLYLFGISLGAWASMNSLDLLQTVSDPIDGAVWAGPPFTSAMWLQTTQRRNPGSPFVLPQIGAGDVVRFTDGRQPLSPDGWGRMRVVFIQYGSDPIVFYSPASAWRKPEWMTEPRAPDVSPQMTWYPVVTMVQMAVDMVLSQDPPPGFGHRYRAAHYVDAWAAVALPGGLSPDLRARIEAICLDLCANE